MKKLLLTLIITLTASLALNAADSQAAITFTSTTYDLGTIKSTGGDVKAVYRFTNTGTAPLVIIKVTNGGCGCTKPTYPKEPIAPGKSGEIVIHFSPSGRRGELTREVKVKTNAKKRSTTLRFSGVIIP